MTAYDKLMAFLEPRRIKRGAFTGQAWLDKPYNRHKRVYECAPGEVAVHMHRTDILVARQDGTVVLHTNGWYSSPTTRSCLTDALYLAGIPGSLTSRRYSGHLNYALTIHGKGVWAFYDGMVLDSNGNLLSLVRPFYKRVADRERRAAERERLKPFLDMLPILVANIADSPVEYYPARPLAGLDVDDAGTYHSVVCYYMRMMSNRWWALNALLTDPRKVRARILREATQGMHRAVPVENV